uniref:hypothetical protein n=1 Tax=Pararhizobium sp. IMCC3301 TaxID=3067904 RepID=UPI0027423CAD|nr:hypothetical protein [Pararhizobium sp. IMCC3301]
MKIAFLAWGSLQWDPRNLKQATEFSPSGLTLPIEFSRISGISGKPRRLTLVIDEENGSPCSTYAAESAFNALDQAKENLRDREGMHHVNGVGYVTMQTDDTSIRALERHPETVKTIRSWLVASDFDAAIWTALASNFTKRAGEQFSVEAALRFLNRQPQVQLAAALEYIRKAPASVQTPIRVAVSKHWPV